MTARILTGLFCSFFSMLVYEYIYQKKYAHRPLPLRIGFLMVFINIVLTVSAALGGALLVKTVWAPADENSARFARLIGIVLGIWSIRILTQIGQNRVRARMGLPKTPLVWVRNFGDGHKRAKPVDRFRK